MNLPHLHLLLNHVPTVGTLIALGLLLTGLLRRHDAVTRVALELFYGVSLVTLPAYISGMATASVLASVPEVSADAVMRHHDAALSGSVLMLATGAAAWLALWQWRRGVRRATATRAVLVLGALTLGLMAHAANVGGEIRHPEIATAGASAGAVLLHAATIQAIVGSHVWVWPSLEAAHFIGLAVLFGVIVLVNLRLLGWIRVVSFSALHRLLPWAALALGVNVVTGMLFVLATPEQYVDNVSFHAKLALLILAGANLLYLAESEDPYLVGSNDGVPTMARMMAVSAVVLWVGVMYFGRMLPFIGGAF